MQQRDTVILRKINSEISLLERMLENVSMQQFVEDDVLQRAAAMSSINIGELAKHLSDAFFEEYPESELRMAARTRDAYAHGYFSLSFSQVYETARTDYPRVKEWIESVLGFDDEAVDADGRKDDGSS